MLEWCHPRDTEHGNSCRVRTTAIHNFIYYARKRGWTDIVMIKNPSNEPCNYIPHFFTDKELGTFFKQCDAYVIVNHEKCRSLNNLLNRFELPIYYRLLLSTCEARWLRREDVDLATGVVDVKKSKGSDEHRIVLHESALEMLRNYDAAMEKVMPKREYMFPKCHSAAWGGYFFRIIWQRSPMKRPVNMI